MDRYQAHRLTRELLKEHKLVDWSVRIENNAEIDYLGLCNYNSRTIVLSGYHIDCNPEWKIVDTIRHEIAHAIVGPNNGHNLVWATKAEELGAKSTPCGGHFALPEHVKDAIRSGNTVEMIEETITVPKFKVTKLQDHCPECGKVAVEKTRLNLKNKAGDDVTLITLSCFHVITKVIPKATPFESLISNWWKPNVKSCFHKWPTKEQVEKLEIPPNQCLECGEFKLFRFQCDGARGIEKGLTEQKGFGIFDEMGLGKTVQALAYIKYHPEHKQTLFIVKSAITFNWFKEIVRWLGMSYSVQIIRTSKDFIFPQINGYVIAYDLFKRLPKEKLPSSISLVVLDEVQQIKNVDSGRTKEVRKLLGNETIKVIALSGTPWKNRGSEFFPVLNMIAPTLFHSNQDFLDTWVQYNTSTGKRKMGGIRNPEKFREYTKSILLRREYDEVMEQYPAVNRAKFPVQLDDLNQASYDESVSDFVKWYNDAVLSGEEDALNGMELLAKLNRMRHITGLAKIPATMGFLEDFIEETDKKIVVFVHHKDVAHIFIELLTQTDKIKNPEYYELALTLRNEGIKVMKLSAEFDDGERFTIGEEFNKTPRCIMIASTLASGEGVNLQTCSDCIMHERQWNPQNEDQAAPGRFKRIGQKSAKINITFTEAEGTVDEHLDYLVSTKRKQFHEVMNKSEMISWNEDSMIRDLAALIVSKHQAKRKPTMSNQKSLTAQAAW